MKIYADFPFKKPDEPLHVAKVSLHIEEPTEEKILWSQPPETYGSAYNEATIATALATLRELSLPNAAVEIEALAYQLPFNQQTMDKTLRHAIQEAAEKLHHQRD